MQVHGLEELGHELNSLAKQGKWQEMTKAIDDETVHLFCAAGRYDEIARAAEQRFGGLVDVLGCPDDLPPDLVQDLRAIPSGAEKAANA